jgi:hypothetical protein
MTIIRKISDFVLPGKWYYCEMEDGKPVYTDWAVSWLRWAQKQNAIINSTESFVGETQVVVMIELMACDIRFARTKTPSFDRDFYRVSVLGGPLDGRSKQVRTLKEAEALLTEWAHAAFGGS